MSPRPAPPVVIVEHGAPDPVRLVEGLRAALAEGATECEEVAA